MRLLFVGIVLLSSPAVAAGDMAKAMMDAVFGQMAAAYMCRDVMGGLSSYQAAETIATQKLTLVGATYDESVLMVDKMAKKFESDPRAALPNTAEYQTACLQMLNEGSRQIDVITAKVRTGQ
jgi:hypothetical protein